MRTLLVSGAGPARLLALGLVLISVATASVPATAAGAGATSGGPFRATRVTLAGAAGPTAQAGYALRITAAQHGPVGSVARCGGGAVQTAGFWSLLGAGAVPVRLRVDRDEIDPDGVRLLWSGAAPQFTVYRATAADAVADPGNDVLTTSVCEAGDLPPVAPLTFYLVLPAAP